MTFALMKLIIQKRFLIFLNKRDLIMAINDTFKILPKNKTYLEADLTSFLPKKDYWAEDCKKHPTLKECLFYCD